MFILSAIILCITLSVCSCNNSIMSCGWVHTLNCSTFGEAQDCGSDGKTYANRCFFVLAQCADNALHVNHTGPCPDPNTMLHGPQAALDFLCNVVSYQDCHTTPDHVCASNGKTYLNGCEFDKARCTHRDLHVHSFAECVPTTAAP